MSVRIVEPQNWRLHPVTELSHGEQYEHWALENGAHPVTIFIVNLKDQPSDTTPTELILRFTQIEHSRWSANRRLHGTWRYAEAEFGHCLIVLLVRVDYAANADQRPVQFAGGVQYRAEAGSRKGR